MQVAKKALKRDPVVITLSVNSVKNLLESIEQLTDPPLDLDSIVRKTNLFRSFSARPEQMAQWLRTHLQLSEKDLRRCLGKSPELLARSPVRASITTCA